MSYATFFEIGGHVVESYVEDLDGVPSRPKSENLLIEVGKKQGIPPSLMKKGAKEIKKSSGIDLMKLANAPARKRRAQWAFTTALAISQADGPVLPFGDVVAIGFLTAYGTYESAMMVKDLREGSGY